MRTLFGLYLCWLSVEDLREYRISVWKLLPGGVLLIGSRFLSFSNALPGIIALLIARISADKLGCGDGAVILLMGLMVGRQHCLLAVVLAIVLIAVLCVLRGFDGQLGEYRVPAVPFLTMGYVLSDLALRWG